MDITALSNTTDTGAATASNTDMDKDDFLKLLLTQLEHQDPLSPQDSAEFTAQLTQFSTLEELSNVNTTLAGILGAQESMQNTSATNLIGKEVSVSGNTAYLTDTAELGFSLSDSAESVRISIYDASGDLVRTEDTGAGEAGLNIYTWDGKDDNGSQLPAGSYAFEVEALDAAGSPVETVTRSSGPVTEVLYENDNTYLVLEGGITTTLDQILSVSERRI